MACLSFLQISSESANFPLLVRDSFPRHNCAWISRILLNLVALVPYIYMYLHWACTQDGKFSSSRQSDASISSRPLQSRCILRRWVLLCRLRGPKSRERHACPSICSKNLSLVELFTRRALSISQSSIFSANVQSPSRVSILLTVIIRFIVQTNP